MRRAAIIVLVVFLAATLVWTAKRMYEVQELTDQVSKLRWLLMQTITTAWMSNGIEQRVTTNRKDSETLDEWLARHDEAVVAAQRKYPKDE